MMVMNLVRRRDGPLVMNLERMMVMRMVTMMDNRMVQLIQLDPRMVVMMVNHLAYH